MHTLTIDQTKIQWDLDNGLCRFDDTSVFALSQDGYRTFMEIFIEMVGEKRYSLAIQNLGRQNIENEWEIVKKYKRFSDGIDALSHYYAVHGWGNIFLEVLDVKNKKATFRVYNSLEGTSQKEEGVCYGSAMLLGKCARYCEESFKVNCWAEQTKYIAKGDPYDEFVVTKSTKTIEKEMKHLLGMNEVTKEDMEAIIKSLENEIKVRKKAEKKAKDLANVDSLTGLTNRRYFYQKFSRVIHSRYNRKNTHGVLCIIDVDDFKSINDSLGHIYGDECLVMVSERLVDGLESLHGDVSISRIAGDSFAIILGSLSMPYDEVKKKATVFSQHILNKFDTPLILKEKECHIKISMGISVFETLDSSIETIFKEADMALYKAKQLGKNQFCFFEDNFKEEVDLKFEIMNELKNKMRENRFLLHYQPIVNKENELIATEVLARWKNADGKLVEASDFISLIEVSGHTVQFNKFIIEEAFKQLKQWEENGLSEHFSHLSINISPAVFMDKSFTRYMIDTIDTYNVNPKHIMLEITENNILSDFDYVQKKMDELNHYGIRFSLDDFGTGYSSLSYINKLPFSELKIDSTFTENLENDRRLLSTIIAMAKSMDFTIVAEGIEEESQYAILKEMECDLFQGYLFQEAKEPLEKI